MHPSLPHAECSENNLDLYSHTLSRKISVYTHCHGLFHALVSFSMPVSIFMFIITPNFYFPPLRNYADTNDKLFPDVHRQIFSFFKLTIKMINKIKHRYTQLLYFIIFYFTFSFVFMIPLCELA